MCFFSLCPSHCFSVDSHTSVYRHKFSFSVEICPICKDDLICLPQKTAHALGNPGPLVLCVRVSNSITLLDPNTLQTSYLDATQYWRYGFKPILSAARLVEYIVLDIEIAGGGGGAGWGGGGGGDLGNFHAGSVPHPHTKFVLAEAQVVRVSDFGRNDTMFVTRTHLGHLLRPGDRALGYDLAGANINSDDFAAAFDRSTRAKVLPDVILVRKSYEAARKKRRGKPRGWKLKTLGIAPSEDVEMGAGRGRGGGEEERDALERERFMDEIEEDKDVRSRIMVFKDEEAGVRRGKGGGGGGEEEMAEEEEEEGSEPPEIPLEELLSDLRLDEKEEGEVAPGGDGDDMEH